MEYIMYLPFGAVIGSLLLARFIGKKALLIGALVALIPEIQAIVFLFISDYARLKIENIHSHSLFFIVIASPIVAALLSEIIRDKKVSLSRLTVFSFWAMGVNPLFDLFTIKGIGLFHPFSDKLYSFASITETDYYLFLPAAISCLIILLLKPLIIRRVLNWFTILYSLLYISYSLIHKIYIVSEFETRLFEENMPFTHIDAFPHEGGDYNWYLIARNSDGFWEAAVDDYGDSIDVNFMRKEIFFLIDYEDTKEIKLLDKQVKMWYNTIPGNGGAVYFIDLRYGRSGDKYKRVYQIWYDNDNSVKLKRL